jgi:hypothetical protein
LFGGENASRGMAGRGPGFTVADLVAVKPGAACFEAGECIGDAFDASTNEI